MINAEAFLTSGEREAGKGFEHIPFHLAILTLEEIGKAVIAGIKFVVSSAEADDYGPGGEDDHVRKLFWAIVGGSLRSKMITSPEEMETNKNLASHLHEKRINSLYTNSANPIMPEDRITRDEANSLLKLARARLELEKSFLLKEEYPQESEQSQALKWFFQVSKNPQKRSELFDAESLNKLDEFQDGESWINWLKERDKKKQEDMRLLAEKELKRGRPSEEQMFIPKYKIRIRIQSPSHSIKNNAFEKWNTGVTDIKLYKVDKKLLSDYAKSELYVDILLPKAVPVHGVWEHGLFMTKTFLIALNVATKGFFWWKVPKDPEKYYETITDLEADKKERTGFNVTLRRRLTINWDEAGLKLDEDEMKGVSIVLGFLFKHHIVLKEYQRHYELGLALFSKTDIHLRMETNAFIEIFHAMKASMTALGDWDGNSDFLSAVLANFKDLDGLSCLQKTIELGMKAESTGAAMPEITLTEVMAMKLYCDIYLILKANEYMKQLVESERPTRPKSPQQ